MKQLLKWEKYILVFFVSFACICMELFFTRILNLKTYNHIVYVIIPFSILGYGIGANLFFLLKEKIEKTESRKVLGIGLMLTALVSVLSFYCISKMPLEMTLLQEFFNNIKNSWILSFAYMLFMLPFVIIGFLILYLFSDNPKESPVLYFWDLMGAGGGAVLFFFMMNFLGVSTSFLVIVLTFILFGSCLLWSQKKKVWLVIYALGVAGIIGIIPEFEGYKTEGKGWENFPVFYKKGEYLRKHSQWHPLGRTDVYYLHNRKEQEKLYFNAPGTFQINYQPVPEFSYFVTNFLGGTPVYHLNNEGIAKYNSRLVPFSQAMEVPYIFLKNPRVVVIGAGGGRDVFFARTHDATSVVGAEINPEIFRQMSKGGKFYEYSNRIYEDEGVKIHNMDGRRLVKILPENSQDLIVLNGVDTYSGLSSGAYSFVESYLYTKEAVVDYLKLLDKDGILNFNRWFFKDQPRETLRLFAIISDALREIGIENPHEHIMVGEHEGWGMLLVKKSPFVLIDNKKCYAYFFSHNTTPIYPSTAFLSADIKNLNIFDLFVVASKQGQRQEFIKKYIFDISTVTDDSPFFYKYYRLRDLNIFQLGAFSNYGSGFIIFVTQALVLVNAIIFSLLFIGLPLWVLKGNALKCLPGGNLLPFVTYFACLGIGYMFVEVALMQKLSMFLGSPIYSISVVLGGLLMFSGIGSYCVDALQKFFNGAGRLLLVCTCILTLVVLVYIYILPSIIDHLITWPFIARIVLTCLIIAPAGICLGMFFPSALALIDRSSKEAVAWAWGINCGFSAVGSMLLIVLAQFSGFTLGLVLVIPIYWLAVFCFQKLLKE